MTARSAPTESAVRSAVATTVRKLREECGAPVAFGGVVTSGGDGFAVAEPAGTVGRTLAELHVARGEGLGGKALAVGRPARVNDCLAAEGITHAYDQAVATERLRAIVAIPVRVNQVPAR